MTKGKDRQKAFSTCLENAPFAEMMQKMMGEKGIGSLCAGMMKQVMKKQGDGCSAHCAEMMQSMMKECCDMKEQPQKTNEEAGYDREK